MSRRWFRYSLKQENGVFVARCHDIDVASDGGTATEAVANLQEALALYGDDMGWEPMLIPASKDLVNTDSEWVNASPVGREAL